MLHRRRARQHPRPRAPRLGHGLHQAAARLAAVQPGRRLDHARASLLLFLLIDRARHADSRERRAPRRCRSRSPTRTSTCSWSTRGRAWSCTPRAGIARTRSRSCWRRCSPRRAAEARSARGDRPPPRPRHLGPAGASRAREEALRRLQAALGGAADRARVPGARGGPPAGAHGHDRGADRARPARAHAHGGRRRRRRARRARTSRSSARSRAPRCCACAWRRAAPTRSACTCRRSAIRCAETPSTARPGCSGSSASSCTPRAWRSSIRSTGERVEVGSPLPADLQAALERAERVS